MVLRDAANRTTCDTSLDTTTAVPRLHLIVGLDCCWLVYEGEDARTRSLNKVQIDYKEERSLKVGNEL